VAHFNEALAIDPAFAPAYAGLADCYAQMGSVRVGILNPLEAMTQAQTYLTRAMDLDDTLAEAHCTSGLIKSWYEFDWVGAEREFHEALRLDPGQVTALLWQSLYLSVMGRHQEAIASMQRARESEPLSQSVNLYLGVAQTHAGHYDLAIRQLQQSIELDPHYYRPYMFLGRVLMFVGRHQEAIDSYRRALSFNPDNLEALAFMGGAKAAAGDRPGALRIMKRVIAAENRTETALLVASIYASLGDASPMFEWLQRAVERRSTPIYIALISAEFHPYKTDPRFHIFLDSIGLSNLVKH